VILTFRDAPVLVGITPNACITWLARPPPTPGQRHLAEAGEGFKPVNGLVEGQCFLRHAEVAAAADADAKVADPARQSMCSRDRTDGNRAANNDSDRYLSVSACLPLPARAELEQSTTVIIQFHVFFLFVITFRFYGSTIMAVL